jgi:hypothetical protein
MIMNDSHACSTKITYIMNYLYLLVLVPGSTCCTYLHSDSTWYTYLMVQIRVVRYFFERLDSKIHSSLPSVLLDETAGSLSS